MKIKYLIKETINTATTAGKNIAQVGIRLMKFCAEYDLQKISEQVQSQRIQRAVQAKTKNHPQKIGIKLLRSARMRLRLRQKTNKLSMMVQKSCKIKKRKSRSSLPILGQLQMLRDSATKGNLSVALNIRTKSLRGPISPWPTLLRMSNT